MIKLWGARNKWFSFLIYLFLAVGILAVLKVSFGLNLFRLSKFAVGKFDTGNMIQAAWNTAHGHFLEFTDHFGSNVPRHAIAHVDPILFLLSPIFWFTDDIRLFVLTQPFLLVLGAIPIFFLAKKHLGSELSALFWSAAYLCYPALGWMIVADWHGVTFSAVFFLYAFWFFDYWCSSGKRKDLGLFWVFILLSLLGKENVSLLVASFGVWMWAFRGKRKLGLSLLALGVVWFVLCFFVISPYYGSVRIQSREDFLSLVGLPGAESQPGLADNFFLERFSYLGGSYAEILKNVFLKPRLIAQRLFNSGNWGYLFAIFAPLGFLSFLAPSSLIIILPDLLINFLATPSAHRSIRYHHISTIIPVVFVSAIFGLSWLKRKGAASILTTLVSSALVFSCFYFSQKESSPLSGQIVRVVEVRGQGVRTKLAAVFDSDVERSIEEPVELFGAGIATTLENADKVGKGVSGDIGVSDGVGKSAGEDSGVGEKEEEREEFPDPRLSGAARDVLELIPPTASVSAPDYLGAFLATRRVNARFPGAYRDVDFVVIDLSNAGLMKDFENFDKRSTARKIFEELQNSSNYVIVYQQRPLFVFKKEK